MRTQGDVLAAVDGSEVSGAVLGWARALADGIGSDLRVLHVGRATEALRDLAREEGLLLEEAEGAVVPELLHALDEDVFLAVLGTRSSSPGATPAGSTALAVLHTATKPVLLVPPGDAIPRPARLTRVAVPLDGTEEVSRAVQGVVDVLLKGGVDVVVLHVFDRPSTPAFWDRPARDPRLWSGEFLARYCDQVGARVVLATGDPGEAALEALDSERVDAVLLAWRQDDAPGHAATLKQVVSESTVPVLVVPMPGGSA